MSGRGGRALKELKRIGFIGVGVMGKGMVRNLMKAGFEVSVWARHPEKVQDVVREGAHWCDTLAECAAAQDAVLTIVGFPADVEEVYFGPGGILESVQPGTLLVDMTTTRPQLSQRIARAAAEKGCSALDAPVSGGDAGARQGTLTIMVGGDRAAYDTCLPLFVAMGNNIVYHGPAGSGQNVKMANQIMIAGALAGVCEAFAYADAMGLDKEKMLQSVATGSAASRQLELYGPRILKGDYAPGFFIKHFVKDMTIASEAAEENDLHLNVLEDVLDIFRTLQAEGYGEDGTQRMVDYYA